MKKFLLAFLLLATIASAAAQTSGVPAGLILVQRIVVSSGTEADFTRGISSLSDEYILKASTTGGALYCVRVSEDGGTSWKAGASDYQYIWDEIIGSGGTHASVQSANSTQINLMGTGSRAFTLNFSNPSDAANKQFYGQSTGTNVTTFGGFYKGTANPINGVRVKECAGAAFSGVFTLYRLRKQ